jgi:hypothetical protein
VGRNRIGLSSAVLGRELVVRLPDLQADELELDLPQGWLSAGMVRAQAELSLNALGRRDGAPQAWDCQLRMERATVQQLTLVMEGSAEPDRATGPARARSA